MTECTGDMRQVCIEKTINIIDSRAESQKETASLRIELMILKFKDEMKLMITDLFNKNKEEKKEKVSWFFEVVRFAIYVASFFLANRIFK